MPPRELETAPLLRSDSDEYISVRGAKDNTVNNDHEHDSEQDNDGGWGWVVVLASFTCCFVLDGVGYTFGVFLDPLLAELGGGVGGVAAAGSLQVGVYAWTSPVAAKLVDRFGYRRVCISGAVISSIGFLLASLVRSLPGLLATYSLITGLGFGLMYIPAIVAVADWFTRRRGLAIAMCLCGAGAGTFALAPLIEVLLEGIGWRWTFRCLSLACLACTLCGAAMAPGPGRKKENMKSEADVRPARTVMEKLLGVDLSGHRHLSTFLVLGLADTLTTLALYIPYTHLPPLAKAAGVPASQAAFLISAAGISNTMGRLVTGWMADQTWANAHVITMMAVSAAVVIPFLLACCSVYWSFLLLTTLFGYLTGCWISSTSPLLVSLLGVNLLTPAFGFLTATRGTAALVGPPLAGLAVDLAGDKAVALFMTGGILAGAALVYGGSWGWRGRRDARGRYEHI